MGAWAKRKRQGKTPDADMGIEVSKYRGNEVKPETWDLEPGTPTES
jgi:hypothetical protein